MIEIVALDHPGLLANIAAIFQRCKVQIHSAKITTFGEKAEDVFTVSNIDNQPLTDAQKATLKAMLSNESQKQILPN